jgi:2-polyprenyl-6-methoxyphenol hydroxylase-like FAD-dependent oxidoreductase
VTFGLSLLEEVRERDPALADELKAAAVCWDSQVINIRGQRIPEHNGDAYNISRLRLIDILTRRALDLGVRIEHGTEIASLDQLAETIDLVVAADGVSSQVRELTGGFATSVTTGENKYIWLGSDQAYDAFNFFFIHTEHGWLWAHAYSIDDGLSTFIVECAPRTWAGLGFDTMSTGEALPVLEDLFKAHLDGSTLIGELPDGSTARWLNFKTVSNEHWHSGRTVLIGDSAHTTHFSIGMGTTLALKDAAALADHLGPEAGLPANLPAALAAYEEQRKQEMAVVAAAGHNSGRWFERMDRYIGLPPRQFAALMHARRSPVVAALPPRVSYLLREAVQKTRARARY